MRNDPIKDRFGDTAQDIREYANLQLEDLKLRLLEKLSTLFNNVLSILILIFLASTTLNFIGVVLVLLLAKLIGSLLIAVAIMAGVFLIATLIVYACRKKMFINPMVRMLSKMLFDKEKEED